MKKNLVGAIVLTLSLALTRPAAAQVVVFGTIHEIAKGFHVDGLDAGGKSGSSRSLKAS